MSEDKLSPREMLHFYLLGVASAGVLPVKVLETIEEFAEAIEKGSTVSIGDIVESEKIYCPHCGSGWSKTAVVRNAQRVIRERVADAYDLLGGYYSWNDTFLDDKQNQHLWIVRSARILREIVGRPAAYIPLVERKVMYETTESTRKTSRP